LQNFSYVDWTVCNTLMNVQHTFGVVTILTSSNSTQTCAPWRGSLKALSGSSSCLVWAQLDKVAHREVTGINASTYKLSYFSHPIRLACLSPLNCVSCVIHSDLLQTPNLLYT